MTQILVKPRTKSPQTHVLIVGVGEHRHLLGSTNSKPAVHMGLKNLQSPPASALAVAQWILGLGGGGLQNPSAPLGTVEILISAQQPSSISHAGSNHALDRATTAKVKAGFNRWIKELSRNPQSVGILYFAGHGVIGAESSQYVLLEDFASDNSTPFTSGIFDITNTTRALERRVQGQIYVFIDACRTYSSQLGGVMGAKPAPLLQETSSTKTVNQGITIINSASDGQPAYGDSAGITRFTKALLLALKGYCGVPVPGSDGQWNVNGEALCQAMPKLLRMINSHSAGTPQSCSPYTSGIADEPMHVMNTMPLVKVQIAVSPKSMQSLGTFSMHDAYNAAGAPISGGGSEGTWEADAARGVYHIEVLPKAKEFIRTLRKHQFVDPPVFELKVLVS